jgi:hypothetical protein
VYPGNLLGAPDLVGGAKQGLGGNPAPVGALSSDLISLDHRYPHAGGVQAAGAGLTGDTGADDYRIKVLAHGCHPLRFCSFSP